jgi:hypothetical protein
MTTFVLAFFFMALVIFGMAIGLIFRGKPIKGSCGGMAALNMDTACDICGGNPNKCEKELDRQAADKHPALAYDATTEKR